MSETTEMILDGTMCQVCGAWMDDVEPGFVASGHPRTCEDCLEDEA